jgi:hypothetical protein
MSPRVTDNDRDEITVTLDGKEIRGWSYASEQERRTKMLCAREFVEGFCTGYDANDLASRESEQVSVETPRISDDDQGEITVSLNGKELRGWSYASDSERRTKMLCARDYVEGFCDGRRS